jgi:hypothetical protein
MLPCSKKSAARLLSIRRAFKEAGFMVKNSKGSPGKAARSLKPQGSDDDSYLPSGYLPCLYNVLSVHQVNLPGAPNIYSWAMAKISRRPRVSQPWRDIRCRSTSTASIGRSDRLRPEASSALRQADPISGRFNQYPGGNLRRGTYPSLRTLLRCTRLCRFCRCSPRRVFRKVGSSAPQAPSPDFWGDLRLIIYGTF